MSHRLTIEHPGEVIDVQDNIQVIACETCQYRHVLPLPEPETLIELYRESFYTTEKPDYLRQAEADRAWLQQTHILQYETLEQYLPAERRRLLEVGSGPGSFLKLGQERGWSIQGIEPSPQATAYCHQQGLPVENAFFSEDAKKHGFFDVVYLCNVLEHVPHPKTFIQIAHEMLHSGGVLVLVVPNDYNPFQEALRHTCGYRPWWVAPTHHLNYFTPTSLMLLCQNNGFELLSRTTSFPMDLFLMLGDNYVDQPALGAECHRKRKHFEEILTKSGLSALRKKLYEGFAQLDLGREIILYCRKQ